MKCFFIKFIICDLSEIVASRKLFKMSASGVFFSSAFVAGREIQIMGNGLFYVKAKFEENLSQYEDFTAVMATCN